MDQAAQDRVALVTGASLGIGAATALELGRSGFTVAVHFNNSECEAHEVVGEIKANGGSAAPFQADLVQPAQCRNLVANVLDRLGQIDVLVNNAGSLIGRRPLAEIDLDHWNAVVDLNLGSVFWMTQAAAEHMRRRGSGAVINIGSIAGRTGGAPGVIAYAAAKGGVTAMTKAMAKELVGDGIRVNAVNPGVILTPLHERFTSTERMQDLVSLIPQGRPGQAFEVAKAIAFLASDSASHIVGESIEVNGGMYMG